MDLQTAPAVHPPLLDSVTEETLRRNVAKVLETLAENRYQDSPPAKLVAVTKTVTPRVINLLKPMEIWDIGENRAQVALPKLSEISPEFHLHWIGRLQTNKVKYIIDHVCLLHALDRMDLAQEIDRRAESMHIPVFLVHTALKITSPNGKSYSERLDTVKTEKQLSAIFDDFINMVPMGQKLFGSLNPVHTGGPMQVSIAFAEKHTDGYPWDIDGTVRQEVFSLRGGLWFGTYHLLNYPANYDKPLYRFADFNAGWYASRNAAFQNAVSRASGVKLALDGDLIAYGSSEAGTTERAVRKLSTKLEMSNSDIRRQLEKGDSLAFEKTDLYKQVFALAEKKSGKALPRAILPGIQLESPKITRNLTTAWFAKRVEDRRARCMGL